jgi:hypothetical protein
MAMAYDAENRGRSHFPSRAFAVCAALAAAMIVAPRAAYADDPPAPSVEAPASPPTAVTADAPASPPPGLATPEASATPGEPAAPSIPVTPESAPPVDDAPSHAAASPSSIPIDADGPPSRDTASASSTRRGERAGVFVAAGLGFAAGRVSDPQLAEKRLQGPLLELHAGVSLNRSWSVGFGISSVEMPIARNDAGVFVPTAGHLFNTPIHVQAECLKCALPASGGVVERMPLNVLTLGPEVQFRPMGDDGPFLGAMTGIAAMPQLTSSIGGAVVARAGYRVEFAKVLAASVQAGVDGQVYSGSSALFPFAGVQLEAFITGKSAR